VIGTRVLHVETVAPMTAAALLALGILVGVLVAIGAVAYGVIAPLVHGVP
jgi:hypothetical protein